MQSLSSKSAIGASPNSPLTAFYLRIYNVVMLLAWSWILSAILYNAVGVHLWTEFQQGRTDLASLFSDFKYFYGFLLNFSQSFDLIGWQLGYIQAIACVEIFHALFGLTTSSVLTSIIQLGSRNAIIWGYLIQFGSAPVRNHFSFSTMVFAWASADILRYAYYLFPSSKILRWLRYTVFYILYPIGAASEFYLVVLSIESAAGAVQRSCHFSSLAALHLLLFFPGFCKNYTYMINQREKVLSKSQKEKRKIC